MLNLDELKFDEKGLIPAIVVDAESKKVLTLSITADCDNDALVVVVEKDGPACHTGSDSCFTKPVYESPNRAAFSADGLYELLADRKETLPEGSYTTYLFEKGIDKILKRWARSRPKSSLRPRAMTRRRPFTRSPIWPITSW